MRDLVRQFTRWVIIVLLILNLVLGAAIISRCQEVHEKHESREDFENTMGFKSIILMSKDDRLVYWKKELKMRVVLSSFAYDKYTRFEVKQMEGCALAIYCKTHNFLYLLTPCK